MRSGRRTPGQAVFVRRAVDRASGASSRSALVGRYICLGRLLEMGCFTPGKKVFEVQTLRANWLVYVVRRREPACYDPTAYRIDHVGLDLVRWN